MDLELLEEKMRKAGITKVKMCNELKMSRSAFYRKCNGISEFTQSEIEKIVDVLHLDSPVLIFFPNKVS